MNSDNNGNTTSTNAPDLSSRPMGDEGAPPRLDVLISRVVDGEATPAEWREFQDIASSDSRAWRELAESQRVHALLCAESGYRVARAVSTVSLPLRGAGHAGRAIRNGWMLGACGGWLAAAAALGFAVLAERPPEMVPMNHAVIRQVPVNTAGLMRIHSEEDALEAYLELGKQTGRVIGEVANRVIVDSEPCDTGDCYKVVFLRQFLETAEVCDLRRFSREHAGTHLVVPVADPREPGASY